MPLPGSRFVVLAAACVFLLPAAMMAEDPPTRPGGPHEFLDENSVYLQPDAVRTSKAQLWKRDGSVSVQVNVNGNGDNIVGDAANEPSIAVSPIDRRRITVGWRQFDSISSNFRQAGRGFTTDGGRSWTFPGVIEPGVFRSDPVLAAAADGTIYYNSLTSDGTYWTNVFTSTDGGATFDSGTYSYGGDKQWMAVDRSQGIGRGHIYQNWDYAGCCGDLWFNRSTDAGGTWEMPVELAGRPFWGAATVGPDGEVYVAGVSDVLWPIAVVARSTTLADPFLSAAIDDYSEVDLGGDMQAWVTVSPNPGGLLGQMWVDVDRSGGPYNGHVYALASVDPPGLDPMDVHFVRSTDGGITWSAPVRVNDDLSSATWQWFGTMSVAPNGRIDVVWNDTRNARGTYDSELYYSFSTDGGVTWSFSQALSPGFDPHLGWPMQNKIGDYYHMVSDRVGADLAYSATFNGEQDVYYLRIGERDCNDNGVGDETEIALGTSLDGDLDGCLDHCQSDLDGDGVMDPVDNCPLSANRDQVDSDNDGFGDACPGLIFTDSFEPGTTVLWSASVP